MHKLNFNQDKYSIFRSFLSFIGKLLLMFQLNTVRGETGREQTGN